MKYVHYLTFSLVVLLLLLSFFVISSQAQPNYGPLRAGDIVFQDTGGAQGDAIKAATKSDYTHCGVVFETTGKLFVFEAVQPVRVTPLQQWRKRSHLFRAYRLKDTECITPAVMAKAEQWAAKQMGKPYDALFQWGDHSLYCSELVWKIYQEVLGVTLCPTKSFQAYFLDDRSVRKIIAQRYGDPSKLPPNEPVVAPADLAHSALLVEVPLAKTKWP